MNYKAKEKKYLPNNQHYFIREQFSFNFAKAIPVGQCQLLFTNLSPSLCYFLFDTHAFMFLAQQRLILLHHSV